MHPALSLLAWIVAAGPVAAPVGSAQLVRNGAFEAPTEKGDLPSGWSGHPRAYRRAAGEGRQGSAAPAYENDDPQRYVLATQPVDVRPGAKYRFSGWVKTEKIAGSESGATLCLEWSDAKGKWLGGNYPAGVRGTHDWTQVAGVTRIPAAAASVRFSCYVRKGMTGKAWFDDVEMVRVIDPPLQSIVTSPVYRGQLMPGQTEARILVRLNTADLDIPLAQLRCRLSLDGRAGELQPLPRADGCEFTQPLAGASAGKHLLAVELLEGNQGRLLARQEHTLVCPAGDARPRVYIDQHRRCWCDGKLFFPLGMYFTSIKEADLKEYADSKFNCLMPYGSPTGPQLDLAAKHGLKVIYSVKDMYFGSHYCPKSISDRTSEEREVRARFRQFRSHPALLAWYLNDELPLEFLPQLETHYRWAVEEDPDHPTWAVLYQFRDVAEYHKTFDVIGTDPYPIGRQPASQAAEWTAETFRQVGRARPLWQVPQLHNWLNYHKDQPSPKFHTPTRDEVRSMAWQCIAEGATGLVFYSWYDMKRNPDVAFATQWAAMRQLAEEIDRWTPVLLSVEAAPAVTAVTPVPGWLHTLVRQQGQRTYLFAVNDGNDRGEARWALPAGATTVRRVSDGKAIAVHDGRFADTIAPLDIQVYELGDSAGTSRR